MLLSLKSTIESMHNVYLGPALQDEWMFPDWMGAPIAIISMAAIAFAYRGHGLKGLSVLMIYITALMLIQLSLKKVLISFPYPMFMSASHFVFSMIAVSCSIRVTGESYPDADFQSPKFQGWYMRKIVPTCMCQYFSIIANNVSLLFIGAGINAMISLATPVATALLAAMFGMKIVSFAWLGVFLVVFADCIVTEQGFKVSAAEGANTELFLLGIVLAVAALVLRGTKTVMQDRLMSNQKYGSNEEEMKNLTPLQSWHLQFPLMIAFGIGGSLMGEGLAPYKALPAALSSPLLYMMIGNIASAVCLNISVMYVIKMLGAPAAQIAGKMNVLVVAALSCGLLGETLTLKQGASSMFIFLGAWIFEEAQKRRLDNIDTLMSTIRGQGQKYDSTV